MRPFSSSTCSSEAAILSASLLASCGFVTQKDNDNMCHRNSNNDVNLFQLVRCVQGKSWTTCVQHAAVADMSSWQRLHLQACWQMNPVVIGRKAWQQMDNAMIDNSCQISVSRLEG